MAAMPIRNRGCQRPRGERRTVQVRSTTNLPGLEVWSPGAIYCVRRRPLHCHFVDAQRAIGVRHMQRNCGEFSQPYTTARANRPRNTDLQKEPNACLPSSPTPRRSPQPCSPLPLFSQDDPAPLSRAAVKAEAMAAEKAGTLAPAGAGGSGDRSLSSRSTKTRAERKAETREARNQGDLTPAGEAPKTKVPSCRPRRPQRRGRSARPKLALTPRPANSSPRAKAQWLRASNLSTNSGRRRRSWSPSRTDRLR